MAKGMRGGFGSSKGGNSLGGGNMQKLMQQAQKMQEQLKVDMEELSTKTFEITSGGGAVRVLIGGDKIIKELEIKPEVVDPDDIEMLQDLVMAAVNEAITTVEAKAEDITSSYTGGAL